MTYVLPSLIVIWICGLLFLAGLLLNDVRLIYNNLVPGAQSRVGQPSRPTGLRWWHAVGWLPLGAADIVLAPANFLIYRVFGLDRFSFRLTGIDPALLNEAGLVYLKKAVRHEWIMVAWAIAGLILLTFGFTPS